MIQLMNPTKKSARIAGLLYLLLAITGAFGLMYVPSNILVSGDVPATINNIAKSSGLFRMGIVSNLACQTLFIFLVLALYHLLKGVNKERAMLMVGLVLASVPIAFLNELNHIAALLLVKNTDLQAAFPTDQRLAMVTMFLKLHSQGIAVVEIFWGLWLVPFGMLVYQSGFLPRILGALLVIGGAGYVINNLTLLLAPEYGPVVTPIVTLPSAIGELSTVLWLLIKGIATPTAASGARGFAEQAA